MHRRVLLSNGWSTKALLQTMLSLTISLFYTAHHIHAAPLPWTKAKQPSSGAPKSIGGYANGCLQGAAKLPERGVGYRSIRRHRNRYYAHPVTIRVLEEIARELKVKGFEDLEIGDLSQPRGGRMKYGHRSHQSGLDIDVWFGGSKSYLSKEHKRRARRVKAKAKKKKWSKKKLKSALFDVDHPSAVKGRREVIDQRVWSKRHEQLLKVAASQDEVARIFVHFRIKEKMCELYREERAERGSQESKSGVDAPLWLRKLRPWYGHHQHFHIRLHCPEGSTECDPQGPLPKGLGCDNLAWFSRIEKRKRRDEAKAASEAEELRRAKLPQSELRALKREEAKKRNETKKVAKEKRERLIKRCEHLSP